MTNDLCVTSPSNTPATIAYQVCEEEDMRKAEMPER
jgi:hypothetical protein